MSTNAFTKEQTERIADEMRTLLMTRLANPLAMRKTCVECIHFEAEPERCTLPLRFGKAAVRPPARVIAYGCEGFELDDIPF